jgi:thiol-disulfide isomerase/thioredoxin
MRIASVFFISLFLFSIPAVGQESFFYKVLVQTNDNSSTKLFIAYEIGGEKFVDSLKLSSEVVAFERPLLQPTAASLYTDVKSIRPLSVMLANNELSIVVEKEIAVITKDQLQNDFLAITENDRIRPGYFPLYGELYEKNDSLGLSKLAVIFDSLKNDDIQKSYRFFTENKSSLLSLFSFNRFTSFFADYAKIETDFNTLPEWAKNSPDGKNIAAKIAGAKSANIGVKALNFTQKSITGAPATLDSFRGKYGLLDFWASWCAPCRKEHPRFIEIYEQYKNKGFEIVSISLDNDGETWMRAVEKDQLTWLQLSDLRGQQNEVALLYGVQAIPANFLMSPDGIILDKNLKSEDLDTRLKRLLVH